MKAIEIQIISVFHYRFFCIRISILISDGIAMINNTDVELTTWQGIDKLGLKLQENNDISNINFKARIVLVDDTKKL